MFMTVFLGIGLVINAWEVYLPRSIAEEQLQREIEHLQGRR
jgi:hypothetical protein